MINIILFENAFYLIKGEDTFRTFKISFLHILGTLCVHKSANCPCFSLQRGHLNFDPFFKILDTTQIKFLQAVKFHTKLIG